MFFTACDFNQTTRNLCAQSLALMAIGDEHREFRAAGKMRATQSTHRENGLALFGN